MCRNQFGAKEEDCYKWDIRIQSDGCLSGNCKDYVQSLTMQSPEKVDQFLVKPSNISLYEWIDSNIYMILVSSGTMLLQLATDINMLNLSSGSENSAICNKLSLKPDLYQIELSISESAQTNTLLSIPEKPIINGSSHPGANEVNDTRSQILVHLEVIDALINSLKNSRRKFIPKNSTKNIIPNKNKTIGSDTELESANEEEKARSINTNKSFRMFKVAVVKIYGIFKYVYFNFREFFERFEHVNYLYSRLVLFANKYKVLPEYDLFNPEIPIMFTS
ncbi:hypothetical protein AYI68_g2175 [Smittium mucronatum]|uniref:Uncharacterized protein n=1 Tax=Smittium mucronatum TaxID=133383 RepID=A0A1R0H3I6_9FUNG|nr:hypothetical protein AYI68_g2175 [Smittium mucronatum]